LKTAKKYNFHKDINTKDAIIENLKLKDKLMEKVKSGDNEENEENEYEDNQKMKMI